MKEGEEQRIPTLFEILKTKPNMTYNEAAKVQEDLRLNKEAGACITAGMKRDKDATDKMKNKTQEDLEARVKELDNSLSTALEINESHQRYNGKLQTRLTELEEDNKKLAHQVEDLKLNGVRKAGL
jgi:hypothetical protein